jgi:uncharacterized cupredoxin-like copper-binding protein
MTEEQEAALAGYILAAKGHAAAKKHDMELEDQRALVKSEAISRIMAQGDPQKGGKPYSATAAEALVETDRAYMLHRMDQSQAAFDLILTQAQKEAAHYRMVNT